MKTRFSKMLILCLIIILSTGTTFAAKNKTSKKVLTSKVQEMKEPTVNAGSYIVMSGSTSQVVYEEHSERKLPIGNITKFMTAMVVLDNMHDETELANSVRISKDIDKYGNDFKAGDYVNVEDLLEAMLVAGSDEAAEALARYSASKRKIFIGEMNSKAMELGLISTQFANPTGAYDPDHYSTAEEAAILTQAAIRYDKIKKIVKLDSVNITIEEKKNKKRKNKTKTLTNTNPLLSSTKSSERYSNIKGGIYGELTKPSTKFQYAGVAINDDMQLIVVMLDASESGLAKSAIDLLEYGYKLVTKKVIVEQDKCLGKARLYGGSKTKIKGYTETKGFVYIPPEGSEDLLDTEVYMYDDLRAPITAGTKVGEYRIYVADELKGTVDLVCKDDVGEGWLLSKLYISNFATVVIVTIILAFVLFILRLRYVNRREHKRKLREKEEKIREMARKREALDLDRKNRNWTYSNFYDDKDLNDKL